MNKEIKISVICLVYNHEKYIRKCLESLVNQKTNFDYEILIHDDASTDCSADIIREYEKKYPDIIKPIYQTENQYSKGVKIIKTFLYPIAKGKYFAYCEGDDYWTNENKLQLQYDILENHPECSICVHKTKCVNEDGSENDGLFPSVNFDSGIIKGESIIEKFPKWLFHLTSFFVRKDLVYDLNFNNVFLCNCCPAGDTLLQYFSATKGDYYYINKQMSCYRLFSNTSWTSMMKIDNVFIERTKKFIQFSKVFSDFLKLEYGDKFDNVMKEAIDQYEMSIFLKQKNYKKVYKYRNSRYYKEFNMNLKIVIVLSKYLPGFQNFYTRFLNKGFMK